MAGNEAKIVKVVVPARCPHCSEDIMVSHQLMTPVIDWVLRPKDIEAAKQKVITAVESTIYADENNKAMVLAWLNNPDTLFGPEEVDRVTEQVLDLRDKKG